MFSSCAFSVFYLQLNMKSRLFPWISPWKWWGFKILVWIFDSCFHYYINCGCGQLNILKNSISYIYIYIYIEILLFFFSKFLIDSYNRWLVCFIKALAIWPFLWHFKLFRLTFWVFSHFFGPHGTTILIIIWIDWFLLIDSNMG